MARIDFAPFAQAIAEHSAMMRRQAIEKANKVDLAAPLNMPDNAKVREWIDYVAAARSDAEALRRFKIIEIHWAERVHAAHHMLWAARFAYTRTTPKKGE